MQNPNTISFWQKFKLLLRHSYFQAAIFGVFFALIGSYWLSNSHAGTTSVTYSDMPACINKYSDQRQFIHSGNCGATEIGLNYVSVSYTWCAYSGDPDQWLSDGTCPVTKLSSTTSSVSAPTIASTTSPLAITGLSATPTVNSIHFAWDSIAGAGYNISMPAGGVFYQGFVGTSYYDVGGLAPSTSYTFSVYASNPLLGDASPGPVSSITVSTCGSPGDCSPPTAPTNLRATFVYDTAIALAWNSSTDNVKVTGYDIYRGSLILFGGWTGTTYADSPLSPSTKYSYKVYAHDAAGNRSPAASLTVTTASPGTSDTTPPSTPPSARGTAVSTSQINLSWGASTDNVGVTAYLVYRNGTLICTCGGNTFSDIGLSAATTYNYQVNAADAAGNISPGLTFSASTLGVPGPDVTPPSAPTSLRTTGLSSNSISLAWNASTDNVGVSSYRLYRNGNTVYQGTAQSFSDTGLSPSTTYTYAVYAYDAAGNQSPSSNVATGTTTPPPDTVQPSAPTNLSGYALSDSQIALSWNPSTDNIGVTGYRLYRNGNTVCYCGSTSFTDTGLKPSTLYTYAVYAYDAAGNASSSSNVAQIYSGADATAPSAPSRLTATAASDTQINLTWLAPTDNVGVTGYKLYRNGNTVYTGSSPNFSDTGLSPSTTYTYAVYAYDAAGNQSPSSNVATGTTMASVNGTSTVTLKADNSLMYNGESSLLSWTVSGATPSRCTKKMISGTDSGWNGNVTSTAIKSGQAYVSPPGPGTYEFGLVCYNSAGLITGQSSVVIGINQAGGCALKYSPTGIKLAACTGAVCGPACTAAGIILTKHLIGDFKYCGSSGCMTKHFKSSSASPKDGKYLCAQDADCADIYATWIGDSISGSCARDHLSAQTVRLLNTIMEGGKFKIGTKGLCSTYNPADDLYPGHAQGNAVDIVSSYMTSSLKKYINNLPKDGTRPQQIISLSGRTMLSYASASVQKIITKAEYYAWPDTIGTHQTTAKKVFRNDSLGTDFTDCGNYVATVMVHSVDRNYPHSCTQTQWDYVISHPALYDIRSANEVADLLPGDIVFSSDPSCGADSAGHTAIYIGSVPGFATNKLDASWHDHVPSANSNWYPNLSKVARYIGP